MNCLLGGLIITGVVCVVAELYIAYSAFLAKVTVDSEGIHTRSLWGTRLLPWNAKGFYFDNGSPMLSWFCFTGYDSKFLTGGAKYRRDYRVSFSFKFNLLAHGVPKKTLIGNFDEILSIIRNIESEYVKCIWFVGDSDSFDNSESSPET